MGMFNDNVQALRTTWTYKYSAADLLPFAKKMYDENLTRETTARNLMASYMKDMNKSQNDPDIERAKRDIQTYGTLKEQCSVFVHQFSKEPGLYFELGLGDVTFFGLNEVK